MPKKLTTLAAEAIDEAIELTDKELAIQRKIPNAHLAIIGFLATSPEITSDIGLENAIAKINDYGLDKLNAAMKDIFASIGDIAYDFSDESFNELTEDGEAAVLACTKDGDEAADEISTKLQAMNIANDVLKTAISI